MRKSFGFAAGVLVLFGGLLTAKAETFTAYLNGLQQVPVAATSATGYGRVVVNEGAGTLTFSIVFNGLGSAQTLSHIHAPAAIGANAAVIIDFGAVGGTSGTISGTRSITPTQLAQLRSGQGYINVHSVNFPNGEIRGQLAKPRPVDYDGDGRTDYSVLRFPNVAPPGVAQISYFNLNSNDGFQSMAFGNANTDFPTPGDYDGDSKDDFGLYRNGTNPGDPSFTFLLRSASSYAFSGTQWGFRGDQGISRDYDGDGRTDIAVFRRGASAGNPAYWYILQSTTNTLRSVQWGTTGDTIAGSGDTPVPGDYDGDGKYDLAVYRFGGLSPNNTFLIQRSSDGTSLFQTWGNFQTDYIAPGDFDGDGKTDFVAVRFGSGSTMNWFILRSSNGSVFSTPFGISTDRVVQGDYDGDGRTDVAVFRSPGQFYVLRSLTNSFSGQSWGLAGDFPVNTFDAR